MIKIKLVKRRLFTSLYYTLLDLATFCVASSLWDSMGYFLYTQQFFFPLPLAINFVFSVPLFTISRYQLSLKIKYHFFGWFQSDIFWQPMGLCSSPFPVQKFSFTCGHAGVCGRWSWCFALLGKGEFFFFFLNTIIFFFN